MLLAWRDRVAQIWLRQLPLIGLSIAHIVFWTAAALLCSKVAITNTDTNVLLQGLDNCGWISPSDTSFWESQNSLLSESANYGQSCYQDVQWENGSSQSCSSNIHFPVAYIEFDVQSDVGCPFPDAKFCRKSTNGPIRLTSELINSNDHLGINASPDDQISYRREMTCAPLPDAPDGDIISESSTSVFGDGLALKRQFRYVDWASRLNKTDAPLNIAWLNFTAQDPYHFTSMSIRSNLTDEKGNDLNDYQTIGGLMPVGADFDIAIMTNNVKYQSSFNDTLFSTVEDNGGKAFSAFACATKHQFCNPINNLCTKKGGWSDIGFDANDNLSFSLWNNEGLTPLQHATIYSIRTASSLHSLNHIFSALQSQALLAARGLNVLSTTPAPALANNQTQQEMRFWFATGLAALQHEIHALPTSAVSSQRAQAIASQAPELQQLCHLQRTTSGIGNYVSISVLGLSIILAFGTAIILASILIRPITAFWQKNRLHIEHSSLEWRATELFHLLKSACEGRNVGTWTTRQASIPTTMPYEKFLLPQDLRPDTATTIPNSLLSTGSTAYPGGPLSSHPPPEVRNMPAFAGTSYGATNGYGVRVASEPMPNLYPDSIANLQPGTSRNVGSVRYTALSTGSTARERGNTLDGLLPPMVMHRDGERPASWVMVRANGGATSTEQSQREALLSHGHRRTESDEAASGSGDEII
jgi:hypothetical protein